MTRALFPHPDADPAQDQDEARADVRRRIDQLKARGVEHDRAVDAVLPPGSQARAWFFGGGS